MTRFLSSIIVCSFTLMAFEVGAQTLPSPEDPFWRYRLWMETAGLTSTRELGLRSVDTRFAEDKGPWSLVGRRSGFEADDYWSFRFEGVGGSVGSTYNQVFPTSVNLGGLWEGVGFTPWTKAQIQAGIGPFTARLGGMVYYSQNSDFILGPSGLANQPLASIDGAFIDTPQRFGTLSFASYSLYNSEFRVDLGPFFASISNQNLWFGPAVFNPLLLSSQAKGFPHIRIGSEGWETPIGTFESQLVYGRLSTSKYWNPAVDNGDRFFGGLFIGYRPSFFPELTIGAGRTLFSYWNKLDWIVPLTLLSPGTDETGIGKLFGYGTGKSHQHVSITWRLRFPESGFETYGEWGKNDYSPIRLLMLNPDHQIAYTLGMKKTLKLSEQLLLGIGIELTGLDQSKESLININSYTLGNDWYSHWAMKEGYTNDGQVLGASIGNGSSAQILYLDIYNDYGHIGLELRRWANRLSALYLGVLPTFREYVTDVEYDVGTRFDYRHEAWIYSVTAARHYDFNRYMLQWNDVVNWRFSLSLSFSY